LKIEKDMRKLFVVMLFICLPLRLLADEGMWLLTLIDELTMNKMESMGLNLTEEEIYSINQGSLKDAVAIFGGFCTSEMISGNGLMLTNYHCAYRFIQELSSVENDYLSDGFWAAGYDEEIPVEGLTVTFMVSMEDVTDRILDSLPDTLTYEQRKDKIDRVKQAIEQEATEDNEYIALVEDFYQGNEFYLVLYQEYSDVRMVGVPPSFIGEFGDETDNWMWPRHTGDFALFRVYCAPDGEPANYADTNIPYTPKHFLPVSKNGVSEDDFTMTLGFPGSTYRYMTSYGIEELKDVEHPNRIKIRGKRQEILKKAMKENDTIRIKYANKYAASSNYWKYSIGQLKCINDYGLIKDRKKVEDNFTQWISLEAEREEKYGDVLETIKNTRLKRKPIKHTFQYINETIFMGSDIMSLAIKSILFYQVLQSDDTDTIRLNIIRDGMKQTAEEHFENYDPAVDKAVTLAMLKLFYFDVDKKFHPDYFSIIKEKYHPGVFSRIFKSAPDFKGPLDYYVEALYDESVFATKKSFDKFMNDPETKTLEKDPAFRMALSVRDQYYALMPMKKTYDLDIEEAGNIFMAGLMEMYEDVALYPDANFTMRLSYGKIRGYVPRDAVYYDYYTTLSGLIEKEDTSTREFIVPDKLKNLYAEKDYGTYAEENHMPVCFVSDNDITGGNSGSPVINGDGALIGLAFDGNWEAMGSDIAYNYDIQRAISVDIRYVLFIIDKFANAGYLLEEMKIIE